MICYHIECDNIQHYITLNAVFLSRVMVQDPFHANCLPVHIGTLVELSKANGKLTIAPKNLILTDILEHPAYNLTF